MHLLTNFQKLACFILSKRDDEFMVVVDKSWK